MSRKRCGHENVNQLEPGDLFALGDLDWPPMRGSPVTCRQLRCLDCGAWLSLGPSNDKPDAVRVEIRAAELAARGKGTFVTGDAWSGWHAHERDWEPCPFRECLACYLARAIVEHDKEAT